MEFALQSAPFSFSFMPAFAPSKCFNVLIPTIPVVFEVYRVRLLFRTGWKRESVTPTPPFPYVGIIPASCRMPLYSSLSFRRRHSWREREREREEKKNKKLGGNPAALFRTPENWRAAGSISFL